MSLSKCMEIVNRLDQQDADNLLKKLDEYIAMGVPPERAQKMAAMDVIAEIEAEKAEFIKLVEEQHPAPKAEPISAPAVTVATQDESTTGEQDDGFGDQGSQVATQSGRDPAIGSAAAGRGNQAITAQFNSRSGQSAATLASDGQRNHREDEVLAVERIEAALRRSNQLKPDHPGIQADFSTPETQALDAMLDVFSELTGTRGIPIDWKDGSYGMQWGKNFFVNVNKPDLHVGWSIGHEFKHLSEQYPGLETLYSKLWHMVGDKGKFQYFSYLKRTNQVQSSSIETASPAELKKLKDEMLADFMGKRFTDRDWLKQLAKQKPNLFGQFVRDWIKLLGNLISRLKGKTEDKVGVKNVDKYITQLETAKAIATDIATYWAEHNPNLIAQSGVTDVLSFEAQLTWGARPSPSTGLLRGIADSHPGKQKSYLQELRSALSINSVNQMLGWGVDRGDTSRYNESISGIGLNGNAGFAVQSTLSLPNGILDSKTRKEIEFFLATRGMWLAQDGTNWHTPKHGKPGLGVEFNLGGKQLTMPEFEELQAAVRLELNDYTVVPIQSKDGVRFLNFTGMDQQQFINKLKKAINDTSIYDIWNETNNSSREGGQIASVDQGASTALRAGSPDLRGGSNRGTNAFAAEGIRTFDFAGEQIQNDWSRGENQFRERAVNAWRDLKDLSGYWLPKTEAELDTYLADVQRRVDTVNAKYEAFWGNPSLTAEERQSGVGVSYQYPPGSADTPKAKQAYFKRPDGTLQTLYHGTASIVDNVAAGVGPATKTGAVFYASTSPGYAEDRAIAGAKSKAKWRNKEIGANVIPCYITATNPFDWRIQAHRDAIADSIKVPKGTTRDAIANGIKAGEWMDIERKEVLDAIKQKGFDSFLIRDDAANPGYIGIGVFDPADVVFAIGYQGVKLSEVRLSARDAVPDAKRRIAGRTTRVYTPEQMKAFANVGFDVEVPTLKERTQALWKDAGKKLAQGLVDQFAPIKEISKEAYGLLRLAKGSAGSFETLLKGGMLKLTGGVYDFDETRKGGVIDRLLKPMQGEHHDFLRWVAANRAERLTGDDKEHLFTQDDINAIKTLADGLLPFTYEIQHGPDAGRSTRKRAEMYADSLITFNAFNNNVLDMAEQSGLIAPEIRAMFDNEFYLPFYRATAGDGIAGASGGAVRKQAFKQLKGGTDKLNADLLDNVLLNWAHLLDASAKNRAAKASLEAAEAVGVAVSTDEETARQMGKSIGNKGGVVWYMDEGIKRYFLVDDPYVLTAITSLEYAGLNGPIMTALSAAKSALTIGVTASPFFKIRNLIRDSIQVIGTGPISYNPAKNLAEGWKLTNPENDIYFRLLAGGGTIHFGTMLEGSEAKRVQALVESGVDASTILGDEHKIKAFYRKYIEPGITAYNELGNRGEAINRAALYDQLVRQGVSHADASLQARDLMDFSMQGSFTTVRLLSQVVPFLNARIQGLYKLGRAAQEDPRRLAYVTGAVALASLALLAAYGDDDDWRKRQDWDRNNFWWFKFGGVAFRIPKPFELGAIGTLAERSAELLFDKEMTGKRFRAQVLTLMGDNLSMNPVPQLVKPMLDVYANRDSFTGNPIEPMGMERLKSDYRFNGNTSMTARAASTALNAVTGLVDKESLSPVQIDSLITGYFGWLGMFAVATADIAARQATDQPTRPSADLWKVASAGMLSSLNGAPSRYVTQVYEQAHALEEAYSTWHALMKAGKTEEAAAFKASNDEAIRKYHSSQAVRGAIGKINQQIQAVELSNIDRDAKRVEIRRLNARKEEFARRLAA